MPRFRFQIKHIRTRYSLHILLIIILVAASISFLALRQSEKGMKDISFSVEQLTEEALLEQMNKKAEVVVATLAQDLINPFYYLDIETINQLFHTIKTQEDVIYVYLHYPDGKIVSDGTDENPLLGKILTDEVSKKAQATDKLLLQTKGDILDTAMPIYIHGEKLGGVRVGFSLKEIKDDILRQKETVSSISQRSIKNALLVSVIISAMLIILGIVFSLRTAQVLVQPILKLTQVSRKIGKGDLAVKVDIKTGDELEELSGSFNQMAVDLKKSRDEIEDYSRTLEQKVEERTRQLKEAQVQLVQTAKMAAIGQLAAGVAHEINNPLGGILGYAQFILTKLQKLDFNLEDFKASGEYLKHIERESQRCKQIVENLLTFSRRSSEPSQPQDVKSVMENTLSLLKHSLEQQNIKVNTGYVSSLPLVMGNANQLQQVFTNIIINAQHAMPKGGELNISVKVVDKEAKKNLEVSFQDTGCGIPKENLEKIFEPFFTTKQEWKSIGLGLSICYQIIRQHNGEILVSSEVDKGSMFTVVLPYVA